MEQPKAKTNPLAARLSFFLERTSMRFVQGRLVPLSLFALVVVIRAPSGMPYRPDALSDEIKWERDLPGAEGAQELHGRFRMFAGYIDISADKHLYYTFVESQSDPENDPLLVWTNGGPGCSSVGMGFFTEHGPFVPVDGAIAANEYSWNTVANILYVDQPVGTGFSYGDSPKDDGEIVRDVVDFILGWLDKFPDFHENELYIGSQSYGGHWIPLVSVALLEHNEKQRRDRDVLNFVGAMVGNPYVDFRSTAIARIHHLWAKQHIDISTYNKWSSKCFDDATGPFSYKGAEFMDESKGEKEISLDLNYVQNMLQDFLGCVQLESELHTKAGLGGDPYSVRGDECLEAQPYLRFCPWRRRRRKHYTKLYLDQESVVEAMHGRLDATYALCDTEVNHGLGGAKDKSTIPVFENLAKMGRIKLLIYSGDADYVCPTLHTQYWVQSMGLNVTSEWQTWSVPSENSTGDIFSIDNFRTPHSGYHIQYEGMVTLATVQDASFAVSATHPKEGLFLFKKFIDGEWFKTSRRDK